MSELRDAACLYASWGWHVHPLWPKSKAPATKNGKNDATCDLGQVFRWWQTDYNIGINCRESGLVVIDVDPRNGGDDTLWELEHDLGRLRCPVRALTGGGGVHYLFKHPGVPLRGSLGPGVDIKDCGYIVAPPSIGPNGGRYEWEEYPDYNPVPELSEAWLARMSRESHVSAPLTPSDAPLLQIPSAEYIPVLSGRHATGGWVTCPWHKNGSERTPSLKAEGTMWTCFVCEPLPGKQVCGGNIVSFAALLWNYPLPLDPVDLREIMQRLHARFEPC